MVDEISKSMEKINQAIDEVDSKRKIWNVTADNWTNGKYCLGWNVTKAEAEFYAQDYKHKYEGKPYPNGKGWYSVKNFRVVRAS